MDLFVIAERIASLQIYCVRAAYRRAAFTASPQLRGLAGLHVEVQRELLPASLNALAVLRAKHIASSEH